MVLTAENYYSQEANEEYMSVSQFKDFCGTYGKMPCEFTAMEKLKGRWEEPKSKALMVGSYVDSYFEGTLYTFKKKNPDEVHVRPETGNYDRRIVWDKVENQDGQLYSGYCNRGFEGNGIDHKVGMGKRYWVSGFCAVLGI